MIILLKSSKTQSTPNRNVSNTRGNKRPALHSPPQSSSITADDVRNIIQEVIKTELASMLQQMNNTILNAINKELEPIRRDVRELSVSLNYHTKEFEEFQSEHKTLKKSMENLMEENLELKSTVTDLTYRINYMEQQTRSANLEIQCLQENKHENLYTIVKQLASVVGCELGDNDIRHCTRVAKQQNKNNPRPRSVIVQLTSPRIRDQLLASVITYNKSKPNSEKLNSSDFGLAGNKTPVYVLEHLSPSNKALHAATRLKAKDKGYKFVWPERLMSPYTALIRRSGNPFELATVLVSWLIGAGYNAYIVVGCAERDVCMAIRYRTECPDIPDDREVVVEEPPPAEEPRYRLVPLPDLTSKYVANMEAKAEAKRQAALDKLENEKRERIAALEKAPEDDIDGWRTHAWILMLPGAMDIQEPFFVEPSEGCHYPLNAKRYQHIDSVYNNENYYVNIQDHSLPLEELKYDLTDLNCWVHLLAGEPVQHRQITGVDITDKKTAVDTEKHLDMPASWVERLDITADAYEQRYPGSHKVIHYRKVLLEKFSPYSQVDGVVKRITIYDDYALTVPLVTHEFYENRVDRMTRSKIDHVKREIQETLQPGRRDHIIKHTYSMDSPHSSVEANRIIEFNYYPRIDHLNKIVCTPLLFEEHYTDREDRLESRIIVYTEGTKQEPKRHLKDITETYSRNFNIPAKNDIWKRIFHIQDNTIQLLYQYAYNFVTNDTRHFIKPNLAETGGKILYYPDKISGYIADPCAKPNRPLDVYYSLCDSLQLEYAVIKHIRDRETDINEYLKQRHRELKEPLLKVALFDTERNEVAKKGWMEQEIKKAEVTEREKEAEIDPLAPYLARMFGSGHGTGTPLSIKEATLVREQCINDFKARQLARQNIVQERFDKFNTEYKAKRLWYLANQFILTPEKESAYFANSAELSFKVHSLEVRLTRHRDLSAPRYKALIDYLDKHPLLKEYNKYKMLYRY